MVCRSCSNECREIPEANRPLQLECPSCKGLGCKQCKRGYIDITVCPQSLIDHDTRYELDLAAIAHNDKLLPVSGGVEDQRARFISVWRRFSSDVNMIEAEKNKRNR